MGRAQNDDPTDPTARTTERMGIVAAPEARDEKVEGTLADTRARNDTVPDALLKAARPPMPYAPATDDPDVNAMFGKMKPARFPAPLNSPTTDGEHSAQYQAPPRAVPARNKTPLPEPSLLLNCTSEIPTIAPSSPPSERVPLEKTIPTRPAAGPRALEPTVILPDRTSRPQRMRVLAAAVIGICAVIALAALLHVSARSPSTSLSNTAPVLASTTPTTFARAITEATAEETSPPAASSAPSTPSSESPHETRPRVLPPATAATASSPAPTTSAVPSPPKRDGIERGKPF
jgi:hypothetical protein